MIEMAPEPGPSEQLSGPIAWWRCVLKALWGSFHPSVITGQGSGFFVRSTGVPKSKQSTSTYLHKEFHIESIERPVYNFIHVHERYPLQIIIFFCQKIVLAEAFSRPQSLEAHSSRPGDPPKTQS